MPRICDLCGESDGKVKPVSLHVDGVKVLGWDLCLHCRTVAVQAKFSPPDRRRHP